MLEKTIPEEHVEDLFWEILQFIEITPIGVTLSCDDDALPIFHRYIGDVENFSDSYLILELLLEINKKLRNPLPERRVEALMQDKITAGTVGTAVMVMTENMEQQEKNTAVVVQNALKDEADPFLSDGVKYLPPI